MSDHSPAGYDPSDFESLGSAWSRFTAEHPELGYGDSKHAASRVIKRHYPELRKRGVVLRTLNGRYIVHRDKFPAEIFALLIRPEAA